MVSIGKSRDIVRDYTKNSAPHCLTAQIAILSVSDVIHPGPVKSLNGRRTVLLLPLPFLTLSFRLYCRTRDFGAVGTDEKASVHKKRKSRENPQEELDDAMNHEEAAARIPDSLTRTILYALLNFVESCYPRFVCNFVFCLQLTLDVLKDIFQSKGRVYRRDPSRLVRHAFVKLEDFLSLR